MSERRIRLTLCCAFIGWSAAVLPPTHACGQSSARTYEVSVPAEWRSADRLMLLAREVSLPKNQSVVFEFFATASGVEPVRLGSYGVVAESDTATGNWHLEVLPVNVTKPLRRWLEARPQKTTLVVRVDVVDGDRRPLPDVNWTARTIEIDARPQP